MFRHYLTHSKPCPAQVAFYWKGADVTFSNHVFISYAHSDNDPKIGSWVSSFHELLEAYLESTLKRTKPVIWRDKRLSDNEVFDKSITENLAQSAVMVAIVTDNYVESPWCQREAQEFCEHAEKTIGLAPKNLLRVFKVIKRPTESEETLPKPMRNITGTQFFIRMSNEERESDDENDRAFELNPEFGEPFAQKLKLKVSRLAQDISIVLKELEPANEAGAPTSRPDDDKPTVYLAQTGEDRLEDYATLRSELLQRGYRVVPNGVLPSTEAECRAKVEELMATASLSVQLMGTRSGALPGGEGADSISVIQNEFAVQRGRALRRVVSLPRWMADAAVGQQHKEFLTGMLSNTELQGDCDLIGADLEVVKTAMLSALSDIERGALKPAKESAVKSIYVIFDRADLAASKPLRTALEEHVTVLKSAFSGEPDVVREANIQNLAACDGVVIFYGSGSDGWKAAVDGDLLRALAFREGRPFKIQATWLDGELTADKEDLLGGTNVIESGSEFDPGMIMPIIEALNEPDDG